MGAFWIEKEIHRMYDGEVTVSHCRYYPSVEIWIKFLPYDGDGLLLEASVEDKDRQEQYVSAIERGLIACMDYYSLSGLKAIWIDCFFGCNIGRDLALSWAAALALRDALSPDSADAGTADDDWLKKVGLYPKDDALLGSSEIESFNSEIESFNKEHPWLKALYKLDNTTSSRARLDIICQAADSGDDYAKDLLSIEMGASREQFLVLKEQALEENNISLLAAACENYEQCCKNYTLWDAADPTDPDVIECYIRLGEAYKEQYKPAKMSAAYEKAWEHAERLKVTDKRFMVAFAERIGGLFSDQTKPFYDTTLATLWHSRAKKGNWNGRVESAIQSRDIAECLYLGTCYAEGSDSVVQNEKEAERLYLTAKWLWQVVHPNMISDYYRIPAQNKKKAEAILVAALVNLTQISHIDYNIQESIKGSIPPATVESALGLMAKIDEKLGDLYSEEGRELYNYKEAFDCYMAAAKNNNSSAKEKTLKLIKSRKQTNN